MSNAVYPYRVEYPRTSQWWNSDWREISNWCNECIDPGEWNYYGETFVFAKESDYLLFRLKWL